MGRSQLNRRRNAAGSPSDKAIETELERLLSLRLEDLRRAWAERFEKDPPLIRSADVLLRMYAYRIQAEAHGGLDVKTQKKLSRIAEVLERDGTYEPQTLRSLSPGIVLTREWKGTLHKVTVTADGFQHLGKIYRSLSDIARTITGTRWSGPRFFGLESKVRREKRMVGP